MNKRIWMVVILATSLGACSAQSYLAAPDRCQAGRIITINHGPRGIIVAPPNLCVEPGQTVTVNIVPNELPLNTVSTRAKSGKTGDNWLNQSNNESTGRFMLDVPENVRACPKDTIDNSCKYKYTIEIADFAILDPMITIRR